MYASKFIELSRATRARTRREEKRKKEREREREVFRARALACFRAMGVVAVRACFLSVCCVLVISFLGPFNK